jgi:hypothetical protein
MAHPKPTVFFSHSSRDKASLMKLKDLFVAKTGGTIDVFLSSDGQSIPFGRNWVHRVQEGLDKATMMISFITSSSLESDWLFFESGYAHAKGIRVIPVGFLGVSLDRIRPPLSLLQGFNITSHEGFDNLIALVNDEFEVSHSSTFTPEEYNRVVALGGASANQFFGDKSVYVDEVTCYIDELKTDSKEEQYDSIRAAFDEFRIHY